MRTKIALLSLLLALPAQAGDTSGYERQPPARASSTTYTPANASHWPLTPSYVSGALDTLASVLASVSSTATARAAPIYWSVGSTGSITTNSYLGRLGDTSATATSVSPVLIPCAGTVGDMRIQRTGNATATGTFQVFKSSGGSVPSYSSTGLTCVVNTGTSSCSQSASIAVSIGDVLIVRAVGSAWSTGAGTIALKLLCS